MNKIVVVGSLNVDYMIACQKLPSPGETLFADSFQLLAGGKGMNQAVCASKLGGEVHMIGCVGNDANGAFLRAELKQYQMSLSGIHTVDKPTGCAFVSSSNEDNSIMVVKGANEALTFDMVLASLPELLASDLIITQFETPMDTVCALIDWCEQNHKPILVNPAPAAKLPDEYLAKITYLTPNQKEYDLLIHESLEESMSRFPRKLIMTAGKDGVYAHDGERLLHIPAKTVKVVDTTGAGDAWNGAFAYAIVNEVPFEDALLFANEIAATTTLYCGAQSAMNFNHSLDK